MERAGKACGGDEGTSKGGERHEERSERGRSILGCGGREPGRPNGGVGCKMRGQDPQEKPMNRLAAVTIVCLAPLVAWSADPPKPGAKPDTRSDALPSDSIK